MHEIEVFLILDNLDGKKSFGVDKLLRVLASVGVFQIFRPVTYIINLSIKQTTFPDNQKSLKWFLSLNSDPVHCVIIRDQYQFFLH